MKEHQLKIWPEYFQAIVDGTNPFGVWQNDQGFEVGDTLVLQEWDYRRGVSTGREVRRTVSYLLEGEVCPSQPDLCVMSVAPAQTALLRRLVDVVSNYIHEDGTVLSAPVADRLIAEARAAELPPVPVAKAGAAGGAEPGPYSGHFTGSSCGDLQNHDY